jgi:Zn-dependent peptidase ImmA (M78 family)
LTFAREYRGYTQTELASNIKGLSQSNLSKFEKGFGGLSDDILCRIIEFLDFPEGFFSLRIYNEIENAHYRKRPSVNKGNRQRIERINKLSGYLVDRMGESLEYPDYSIKMIDLETGYTPERAASYTRRYFGLRHEPVRDIHSLLENRGVVVVNVEHDIELFDGVSFITDNGVPVIVINGRFSNDRKRFTLAHELGHIVMHLSREFMFDESRDRENEANRFASEFLMPSDAIEDSLRGLKLSSLGELKSYWLTSMASIIRRAKDLKCISNDRYQYFNIELSRKGYKKEEPLNVYIDRPNLFVSAYRMHKDDLDYSDEELINLFDLPEDVLKFFFNHGKDNLRILKTW